MYSFSIVFTNNSINQNSINSDHFFTKTPYASVQISYFSVQCVNLFRTFLETIYQKSSVRHTYVIHFIFLAHVRVYPLFIQLLSHLSEKITNINQSICLINVLNNTNYPMLTLKSANLNLIKSCFSPNLKNDVLV